MLLMLTVSQYMYVYFYTLTHQGIEVTMRYSVKLMEASTPPELFNSGELCQILVRAAASEYMCRDELYGRCLGIQASAVQCLFQIISIQLGETLGLAFWGFNHCNRNPARSFSMTSINKECPLSYFTD